MRGFRWALGAVLLAALLLPGSASAASPGLAGWLASRVTGDAVYAHLVGLQRIADANGGTRGYDQPGFAESVRYVSARLRSAGYQVGYQTVPYTDFVVDNETLQAGGLGPIRALMTRFTPSTPPGGLDARLVPLPAGRTGCAAADYEGLGVPGSVVLLARSSCTLQVQQHLATAAGASAVLTYRRTPSPENIYRFIAFDPPDFTVPTASVSEEDGVRLTQLATGAKVHLDLQARNVPSTTVNVIAETAGGDPGHVVLTGGHLDSVTEGPGINDNASAAGTVLQTALSLAARQRDVMNKVRFVFWGAEELGDIGSGYYAAALSPEERGRFTAVLNAELIASPNAVRFVWDTGSGKGHAITELFTRWFTQHGLPYATEPFDAVGSDHLPFHDLGIPVGGLDSGVLGVKTPAQAAEYGGQAGQLFDRCYHQPCDRAEGINRTALAENAPAMAWVLGSLASDASLGRA
ncbi:M28 family peptidase [Amycolatopsis silviterrae]|uniref:M28 family peptidase n=1 Tax=Amycolatopsis silviterrae TaxID=1656914 RepID=A0ABW5H4J4_9PSEU